MLGSCKKHQNPVVNHKQRPNIIYIMSDDHAATAISAYGKSINRTPNIDRIADEGMIFTQSFCTNALCGPSRAVLLTGKYNHINGQIDNVVTFDGSQETFPKILQKNNYQTAMIGKWHLKSNPTGFDYWSILHGQGSYYNPDFIEMGNNKRYKGYVTDIITEKSIDWIENRDTTKPFCLLMHHKAPHGNWMPALNHINDFDSTEIPVPFNYFDDFKNRGTAAKSARMSIWKDLFLGHDLKLTKGINSSEIINDIDLWAFERMDSTQKKAWYKAYLKKNNEFYEKNPQDRKLALWKFRRFIQDYLGTIQSVDESVGQLLDYLDKKGLAENTIVIYTSDQGFYLGEHGWYDKRFMYEESLKIPLLVRYPKEIPKAQSSDAMVLNLDFAPTILDFAGIEIPKSMQGESFREILKSKKSKSWRKEMYYHYYEYPRSEHNVKRHYGIRTKDFKLIHFYYDIDEWELYDLKNDPNEMNNIYDNPEYSDKIKELKLKLKELRKKYRDNNQDEFLPKNPIKTVKNKALGSTIILEYPYSKKYSGGGANALIDGKISIDNLSQTRNRDAWQGFEEKDLIAIIELKQPVEIDSISIGFAHMINSWIFAPEWVEFYIAGKDKKFKSIGKINRDIDLKSTVEQRVPYTVKIPETTAKYIKVVAKNITKCPPWHKGAGYKAWLFADEIIVN